MKAFVLALTAVFAVALASRAEACPPKQTAAANSTIGAFAQASAGQMPVASPVPVAPVQLPGPTLAPPEELGARFYAPAPQMQAAQSFQGYATQYVPRQETVMVPQTVTRYDAVSVPVVNTVTQFAQAPLMVSAPAFAQASAGNSALAVSPVGCRRGGGLIAGIRADAAVRHAQRAAQKAARLQAKAGRTASVAFAASSN